MLVAGPSASVLSVPRGLVCRICAKRSSETLQGIRPFSTTLQFARSGGLGGLLRSRGGKDKTNQFALPNTPARTRFAPSPTGYLHLGSLRTALYNYLLAKATGGQFIIRVEDTDRLRIVQDAEQRLLRDLKWAQLTWDEGPDVGGSYGPYRQSERLDKYRPFADQLLESGQAYRCFCTAADLEKHKEIAAAQNQTTQYPGTCRSISTEESADRAAKGETHIIRFKGGSTFPFVDRVYGRYEKKEVEDDFILIKSDGFPTYHFANVIDDHLMEITHVIRGAEWLISTPKHIALYNAFKWTPPEFFHVGLLTDNAGQKLSKRNHDVDVSSYRNRGILPSALNNWLVLLGWGLAQGSSKNTEFFAEMKDLVAKFSFKFTKGNIKVNPQKLDSFQHKHADYLFQHPESNYPVLQESILTPTVEFVRSLDGGTPAEEVKSSSGTVFDRSQHGDLISQFATPESAEAYLLKMFKMNTTRYGHLTDLVIENPQLLWTVPTSAYDAGLASSGDKVPSFSTAIAAVEALLYPLAAPASSSKWTQKELQQAISAAISSVAPQYPTPEAARDNVYAALRFAFLGDASKSSKPASVVFYLLGPEESLKRLFEASQALTRAGASV
ncbi:hypothetical protein jhhlp_000075 [Lomentospora prolificans]|uniref:Glutamate--tRNA ligase, mitochondrial n=1 Tax=Lomentospora prolificans TaxID=41688 RepID=A0A2N3NLJ7_9PEZI|nr:hypothetical protein jhhlp_000075 [Lomentospora prolificans]